jgi:hypothetical protein
MPLPFQFAGLYRSGIIAAADTRGLERRLEDALGAPLFRDARLTLFGPEHDQWPGNPNFSTSEGITTIIGEPILVEADDAIPRTQALHRFANTLQHDIYSSLESAHGSYCGIHYNFANESLHLFTDKIGLRGLFVAQLGDIILFASTPTPLLEIVAPYSTIDDAGLAETLAFGHPLGARTHLTACKRLLEAEVVRITPVQRTSHQYHRWTATIDHAQGLEFAADRINQAFSTAVADRLAICPRPSHFAFLSGGMDSRLIVNALCATGHPPVTLNVAPAETQDAMLGQRAADFFGTHHFALPATTVWLSKSIDDGVEQVRAMWHTPENTLWWSGDGGSVGLGHVYLTEKSCPSQATTARVIAQALIDHNNWRISERALKRKSRYLCNLPIQGLIAELNRYAHLPIEKQAYAFLLFNNQRRHLDYHYRTLDQRSHDLILPFFDDRFIQTVLDTPIEHLLKHRVYNQIFAQHLPSAHNIPWQAYPGHEPCLFQNDTRGRYQWDEWASASSLRAARRRASREAIMMLLGGKVAPQLSTFTVALAATATYLGIMDLRYMLKTAATLNKAVNT